MAGEPFEHLGVLVSGVVVEDDMDPLAGRDLGLDSVQEAASWAKRSCQRHTQVFDLPVRRMISLVPSPSALSRTTCARHTCFCAALRFRASTSNRRRSARLTLTMIPGRIGQTRTSRVRLESPPGFKCQISSTSSYRLATRALMA